MTFNSQLEGSPCGQRGSYLFYKSFRLCKNGEKTKSISVGDFFFVQTSFCPTFSACSSAAEVDGSPPSPPLLPNANGTLCIGELQLLWEDKNINRTLTSCRLYFLPQNTPEGRHEHHGKDEVIAMSERLVLHVDDLVQWIVASGVSWEYGLQGLHGQVEKTDLKSESPGEPIDNELEICPTPTESSHDDVRETSCAAPKDCCSTHDDVTEGRQDGESPGESQQQDADDALAVKILSYSQYCRYRAILKRLECSPDSWLYNTCVLALGGFTVPTSNCRLLFCRETFEHPQLEANELHCAHLAPVLKSGPKKKRLKSKRSNSPSSESNASEELRDIQAKEEDPRNLLKSVLAGEDLEEQEFLQRLFKFMRERNTPIERVPHLGFKQINLYIFYTFAQKLGGYDKITLKKHWKHIYDELGGNPGSTSAATCTRRHYERLLLPYERHASGRSCSSDTRKTSITSSSSPATSPILPPTPSNNSEPQSPNSNDNCTSPVPSPGNADQNMDSQQLHNSKELQSPPGCFVPIASTQSVTNQLKQPDVTVVPVPLLSSSIIDSNSVKNNLICEVITIKDETKNSVPVSLHNKNHQAISYEISASNKHHSSLLPKKRGKDDHIAEKGRKWDEIRRRYALEKEMNRHMSASYKANPLSLRSIRLIGKESVASKSSNYAEYQEQMFSKVPYSAGSLMGNASASSSFLSKENNCLPGSDTPKIVNRGLPNLSYDGYCDMNLPRGVAVDERMSDASLKNNGDLIAPINSANNDCTVYDPKENDFKNSDRPSVIKFTHSTLNNQAGINLTKSYDCDGLSGLRVSNESRQKSSDISQSIPAAHQNYSSVNHYSLNRTNLKSEPPLRQQDSNFVMPFNQVKNVPSVSYSSHSSNYIKNYNSPVATQAAIYAPVKKPSISPWTTSLPNGRPPSLNPTEKRGAAPMDCDNVVLDLSCNKKAKINSSNENFQNNGISEERELDLSMKSKRPAIKEIVKDREEVKPRVKMVHPIVRSRHSESSSSSNLEASGINQHDSKHSYKSVSNGKSLPSSRNTVNTATVAAMSPHNHCYMSAENKMPQYFHPEYNSQLPNIHPPPHLYGMPFPMTTAHSILPEQLQANLAVYKELYQKGMYAFPYPAYDFPSPIYPPMYKEQSAPYVYFPK